jgi:hypothetical protein
MHDQAYYTFVWLSGHRHTHRSSTLHKVWTQIIQHASLFKAPKGLLLQVLVLLLPRALCCLPFRLGDPRLYVPIKAPGLCKPSWIRLESYRARALEIPAPLTYSLIQGATEAHRALGSEEFGNRSHLVSRPEYKR